MGDATQPRVIDSSAEQCYEAFGNELAAFAAYQTAKDLAYHRPTARIAD